MFACPLASKPCSEATNIDYGGSIVLTVATEVKSEFTLEDLGILQNVMNLQKDVFSIT